MRGLAELDTSWAGYLLAAFFAVVGLVGFLLWRRGSRATGGRVRP